MSIAELIAVFDSTHNALRFEKIMKQNNIGIVVMPMPREISASCGIAVKFNEEKLQSVKDIVRDNDIQVKKYYKINISNNNREYLALD